MKKTIIEMPVFDGRLKEWRILNLNTGTVYSMAFKTEVDASRGIQLAERADKYNLFKTSLKSPSEINLKLATTFSIKDFS